MASKVEKLFEALPGPGSIEDLGLLIDTIRDVFGVLHVVYLAVSLGQSYSVASSPGAGKLRGVDGSWWRHTGKLGAGTYSTEWGERYAEADYARIDPVIEGAIRSFMPIDWKNLDWSTAARKRFLREAIECGIGNQGYTIPIRGPNGQFAVFVINENCNDDQWARFIEEHASQLLVVAHFFHQKVIEVERLFGPTVQPKLSSRETDVLKLIAIGKSRAQVAHELQISENTLRVYLDSARHKLSALNITHAATIAVTKGIITL
ncbi:MAG: LuxR family transcriptional regulator [Rhodobacteraceae bacterium]|nr:MAG: LuxR family transcriptional regulator [Paracoccaceae bacterium]